jgi:hypothetical protein
LFWYILTKDSLSEAKQSPKINNKKPATEGGSCVNTHTGSVGVAVPQSNIVEREIPEVNLRCSPYEVRPGVGVQCDASVGVRPDASVGVMPDASGKVRPDASVGVRPDASVGVECRVRNIESVNVGMPGTVVKNTEVGDRWPRSTPRILESGIQACGEQKVTKESIHFIPKPTFDLCNVTEGKFNLRKKSTKNKIQESDILVGKSAVNRSIEFRGEKLNGISILSTPTKRKPDYSSSQVSSLRLHFEELPANNQGQCTVDTQYSESPAKKRKWGRGQGGVRSATPGD